MSDETPLRILIVEDEHSVVMLLERVLEPLLKRWPNSKIIAVRKLVEAFEIIKNFPYPDIILLDLTLIDSTLENTISRIDEMEGNAPVVVITGHSKHEVESLMKDHQTPVVYKDESLAGGSGLIAGMVKAMTYFQGKNFRDINSNINRMRQLQEIINAGNQLGA